MDDQTNARLTTGTLAAQAFGGCDPVTKALVPAIHMSATYARCRQWYPAGYIYGRTDNPSVQQAENLIAGLERAEEALLFGSGMSAATGVLLALEKPTHIIASQVMYWRFRSWLREISRYGHRVTFVETSDSMRSASRYGQAKPACFGSRRPAIRCGR
jgi:cystathionine gamma-synthase